MIRETGRVMLRRVKTMLTINTTISTASVIPGSTPQHFAAILDFLLVFDFLVQLAGLGLQSLLHLVFLAFIRVSMSWMYRPVPDPSPSLKSATNESLGWGLLARTWATGETKPSPFSWRPGRTQQRVFYRWGPCCRRGPAVHLGFVRVHDYSGMQVVDRKRILVLGTVAESL